MPDDTDWQSDAEDKKEKKRTAANKFLEDTLKLSGLREAVLGSREIARKEFIKRCDITVPDYVEVICLPADRKERNKLVVFILPEDSVDTGEYWRDSWIAAWEPY